MNDGTVDTGKRMLMVDGRLMVGYGWQIWI